MENNELNEMIIKAYKEYIEGEMIEDSNESIERYVSTLHYDILDDIELNREMFGINQDLTDYEALKLIEEYTEKILKNK